MISFYTKNLLENEEFKIFVNGQVKFSTGKPKIDEAVSKRSVKLDEKVEIALQKGINRVELAAESRHWNPNIPSEAEISIQTILI